MDSSLTSTDISVQFTNDEIYELFLCLQSLDEIGRSVVMTLSHIYPKQVSATQLSELAGYSRQSKYIFKSGVLETLEKENLIQISRPSKRLSLIQIHPNHKILVKFTKLCELKGKTLCERFLEKLLEEIK
ncbi:MAG: hypothetical protein ACXAC7_19150 [Candidatus Hodarchaeales archaeon]|jgi:hypothetical protein